MEPSGTMVFKGETWRRSEYGIVRSGREGRSPEGEKDCVR